MGRRKTTSISKHNEQDYNLFRNHKSYDDGQNQFLAMLGECQRIIFNICLLYTDRQYDNMRDLYQEIVYNLWKAWPRYREECKESTWVYSIALKTAVQSCREKAKHPEVITIDESVLETLADEESNRCYDKLYRLIDSLDDDEKNLVFLYLDRHPLKEIATITGCSEDAVKKRISRLKIKLQKMKNLEK